MIIYGKNAVRELIKSSPHKIKEIIFQEHSNSSLKSEIAELKKTGLIQHWIDEALEASVK